MTKIDIISGFLGAGKTTLIKKLLSKFDRIDRFLDCFCGNRAFITCAQYTLFNLRPFILLSVIIFFYNNERNRLYFFVCRKSSAAFITRTPLP